MTVFSKLSVSDFSSAWRDARRRWPGVVAALLIGLSWQVAAAQTSLEVTIDGKRYHLEGEFLLTPVPVDDPTDAADTAGADQAPAAKPSASITAKPAPAAGTGRAGPAAIDAGPPIAGTPNEQAVLALVKPYLALGRPGAEAVDCGRPWACVADLKTNPQYAGMRGVSGSILQADRQWQSWRTKDGGIAILPGTHSIRVIGQHKNTNGKVKTETFARNAPRIRAQDKTRSTIVDCRNGWPGGGHFCLSHHADRIMTMEGFTVLGNTSGAYTAAIGATSRRDSRLVLIGMTIKGMDNCVRTTGRWVMLFDTRLDGCAKSSGAHGIYASGDWRRKKFCPMLVMVDVTSVNNVMAHAAKSRCAVNYFQGGVYEAASGACIEIPQGGATLIRDVLCRKPNGPQWLAIGFGTDKAHLKDGSPRTDKNYGESNLCAWMTRRTRTNPDVSGIAMGRITIRGLHVVNKRVDKAGKPRGVSIWANPWKGKNIVCRPPHEAFDVTSEGGPLGFTGEWNRSES